MKKIETFMGRTVEYDPVKDRGRLQGRVERGEVSARGYWANLRASWYQMDDQDKLEELAELEELGGNYGH